MNCAFEDCIVFFDLVDKIGLKNLGLLNLKKNKELM